MRFNSLAFRLAATSLVWMLLALPLAGYVIFTLYQDGVQENFDRRLINLVTSAEIDSMDQGTGRVAPPINRSEPLFEQTLSGWYWQIKPLDDPNGTRLVSASLATGTITSPFEQKFPADDTGTRWMNTKGPDGQSIRAIERVAHLDHNPEKPRYSIIVAGPLDWYEELVKDFRRRLISALALVGAGLAAVTLFQIRFGLLPLRRIERGLAQVRSGEATKLEGVLPAEIEPLQTEINALIRSNQEIIERARTQVGNLAHALKTPLAVITNEARETKGPLAEKVTEQAGVMRDQINHYLDRARIAARAGVIGRVTEVRPVIEPLARALERIHRDKDIRITLDCPVGARFQGEKQDLEEMLGNLLDNASKWARRHIHVSVSTTGSTPAARRLVLLIEDDGPGLTAEQRAKLGKRGVRLDETKPGSGLGLSIVIDLAQSYRGSFSLEASRHGGLASRLELPAI